MKKMKKVLAMVLTAALVVGLIPTASVLADGTGEKVLTLGADLSGEQKSTMLKYFGVEGESIKTLTVTNKDEREFLSEFVPLEEIGTKTYSCALVRPTTAGGIQVKTANLTWVTSNMIASTLSTCGVVNCQVLAASPFAVSGTGALTGIIMAYESASGRKLDRKKVRAGTRELIAMAKIGDRIGPPRATLIVNRAKVDVIEQNVTTVNEITEVINNITIEYNISLDDEDLDLLVELLEDIADLDYDEDDLADMEETLDHVEENVIVEIEEEEAEEDILAGTDDAALGEDAVFDSTEDDIMTLEIKPEVEDVAEETAKADIVDENEPEAENAAEEVKQDSEDEAANDTEENSGLMLMYDEPPQENEEETEKANDAPASSDELFDSIFGNSEADNDADNGAEAEENEEEPANADEAPASSDELFYSIFESSDADSSSDENEASEPAASSDDLFDSIFGDSDTDSSSAAEEPAAEESFFEDIEEEDLTTFDEPAEMGFDEDAAADFTISDLSISLKEKDVDPNYSVLEISCFAGLLTTGSGSLTVYDENDTQIENVSMSDDSKVEVSSDEVDVYLDTLLSEDASYYVILSDDALRLDGVSLTVPSGSDQEIPISPSAINDFGEDAFEDKE